MAERQDSMEARTSRRWFVCHDGMDNVCLSSHSANPFFSCSAGGGREEHNCLFVSRLSDDASSPMLGTSTERLSCYKSNSFALKICVRVWIEIG